MGKIQPADPAYRKKAILLVIVATAIGATLLSLASHYQADWEQWLLRDPDRIGDKVDVILLLIAGAGLPLVFAAIYFWRTGAATLKAERYPPPGLSVIRDTPILTGGRARLRGRMIQTVAVLIILMEATGVFGTWWVAQALLEGHGLR